ncbi:MAG: hypothetical protein HYV32_01355 [Candidatus Kerfeldbacteria bacterium]|nr:hypothetical protein [Candidatus Kerfeldbacteria bacterium]
MINTLVKKQWHIIFSRLLFIVVGSCYLSLPAHATELIDEDAASSATTLGTQSPVEVAALIISAFLGLLGIIAVTYIIYAGFLWMTAGGNPQKADKAKGILKSAVIGLVLIMASYSLATYVFGALEQATGYQ